MFLSKRMGKMIAGTEVRRLSTKQPTTPPPLFALKSKGPLLYLDRSNHDVVGGDLKDHAYSGGGGSASG